MSLKSWGRLFRIHQWIKNLFIFFPLIFSGKFFEVDIFLRAGMLFLVFCCLSSGFYIINDVLDCSRDRLHPKKSKRPIAAGEIAASQAIVIAVFCVFLGVFLAFMAGWVFVVLSLLYILLQIFYNRFFKHMVLWDVIFLSAGFLLRIWTGAEAVGVPVSFWLFMCVFVLALFLGFAKRRAELSALDEEAAKHREVLALYGVYFLDQVLLLCACLAIVFYSLYTISPDILQRVGGYSLVPSVIFVIYGILRYLYLIHMQKMTGDDPAELLIKDRPLLVAVACWMFYLSWILYST